MSRSAFLVYVSLRNYDHVAEARRARLALVEQMREMQSATWRVHGHVCENYSPHADAHYTRQA